MKFLKRNANVIVLCILEALVGVLLLINPEGFTSGIIVITGIVLVAAGLVCAVDYFRMDAAEAALSGTLIKGLALLAGGIFCVSRPSWFINVFPILTILYGVIILFAGFCKVQWTIDALRLKTGAWFLPAISAVLSIVCSVIILANPFESTIVLWMFIGITLIVGAVIDILVLFFERKKIEW